MIACNRPHKPYKLVFVEPNPNEMQLTQQAKIHKDTKTRILANQYLIALNTYTNWWKGVVIEQK